MEPEITEFARSYQAFQEAMTRAAGGDEPLLTSLGEHVQDFLGVPLDEIEPIIEFFPTISRSMPTWLSRRCLRRTAESGGASAVPIESTSTASPTS
jgi:hypothetical protein